MNAARGSLGFVHHFEPGTSGRALLLLHGTGGTEMDLVGIAKQLAADAALLSPRGKVLEAGMPRFFRRLREGVFDIEDLKFHANELADFIIAASKTYKLDQSKIGALGFSNGANIAGALLLLRPEVIQQAALLRPMVPLIPDVPPDLHEHSVLIAAGRQDPLVSPQQTAELYDLFKGYGADVTLEVAIAGHQLTTADLEATSRWLDSQS